MKTATLPSRRVDRQLRDAAQTTGVSFAAGEVHAELGQRIQQARARALKQKPVRVRG